MLIWFLSRSGRTFSFRIRIQPAVSDNNEECQSSFEKSQYSFPSVDRQSRFLPFTFQKNPQKSNLNQI